MHGRKRAKKEKEKKRKRAKKVTSENGGRDGKEKRTYELSDFTVYPVRKSLARKSKFCYSRLHR